MRNCLFRPGERVRVTDRTKHRILAPNSVCFVARRLRGSVGGSPNMVALDLVNTKNGKRGKDRVARITVVTAVFPIEFEKRPLKKERWQRTPVVELEHYPADHNNVMAMDPMTFIGWAFAYKIGLRDLFSSFSPHKWPQGQGQPVNAFRHVSQRMKGDPMDTKEVLSNMGFRNVLLEQARALETSMAQCMLSSELDAAKRRLRALVYLLLSNEKSGKKFYNNGELKKAYEDYSKEYKAVRELEYKARLRRWKASPAKQNQQKPTKSEDLAEVKDVMKTIQKYANKGENIPYDRTMFKNHEAPEIVLNHPDEAGMFVIQEA